MAGHGNRCGCRTCYERNTAKGWSWDADRQRWEKGGRYHSGNRNWHRPVHGTTADGQDVTVSFGRGKRDGETGIASGHVSEGQYYGTPGNKGHDHYGPNGESYADRGKYRD